MSEKTMLYGASINVKYILKMMEASSFLPVYIIDGNSKKVGTKMSVGGGEYEIIAPESILGKKDIKRIIISASYFDDICENIKRVLSSNLDDYQIYVAPYAWLMLINKNYDEKLLKQSKEYMMHNEASIRKIYDVTDKKTSHILDFIIHARKEGTYKFYPYEEVKGLQYVEGYFYENELSVYDKLTVIDCGAYTGDTVLSMFQLYGDSICKYYAYEPSKINFDKMVQNLKADSKFSNVLCKNFGVGESKKKTQYGKSGLSFGVVESGAKEELEDVDIIALDEEDIDVEGKLIIKLDVEGSEMDILKGAVKTIKKYNPFMAICIYHRVEDILDIPMFLINQGLKYRFVLKSGIHTHLLAIPQD